MSILPLILTLLVTSSGPGVDTPEDRARRQAHKAKSACEEALRETEGFSSVGIAGSGTIWRLILVCESPKVKQQVVILLGSTEKYRGVPIIWSVRSTSTAKSRKVPVVKVHPVKQAQGKKPEQPKHTYTDCDIIRMHLNQKSLRDRTGTCEELRRSVIGPGGGHYFVFTKHRRNCPIRQGRVDEPKNADGFTRWVFRKGFKPVQRGGSYLKPSDVVWHQAAAQSLKSSLRYIRDYATWSKSPVWRPPPTLKPRYVTGTDKNGNRVRFLIPPPRQPAPPPPWLPGEGWEWTTP